MKLRLAQVDCSSSKYPATVGASSSGAIVRRQPFGGWKLSQVGPGAKTGGPNHLATLVDWEPVHAEPKKSVRLHGLHKRVAGLIEAATPQLDFIEFDDDFAIVKMYPSKHLRDVPLAESRIRSKYNLTVVGVKSPGGEFTYATPETVVSNHDLIIVSGNQADIERFAGLGS